MEEKKAREVMDREVTRMKEVAVTSTNPCVIAEYIAMSDKAVQEKFFHKLEEGYLFKGLVCLNTPSIPEWKHVEVNFECPPGIFCFIQPSFMVVVDMMTKTVIKIVDPYLPTERELKPFGDGNMGWRRSAAPNVAWDGYAPWMMSNPAWNRSANIQWDGWGPAMTQGSSPSWTPVILNTTYGPDSTVHMLMQVIAPNPMYHANPAFRGVPTEAQSHIRRDQVGIILPVQFRHGQFIPPFILPTPLNFDIAFPIDGNVEAVIFVTLDGQLKSQVTQRFARQPQTAEHELANR